MKIQNGHLEQQQHLDQESDEKQNVCLEKMFKLLVLKKRAKQDKFFFIGFITKFNWGNSVKSRRGGTHLQRILSLWRGFFKKLRYMVGQKENMYVTWEIWSKQTLKVC